MSRKTDCSHIVRSFGDGKGKMPTVQNKKQNFKVKVPHLKLKGPDTIKKIQYFEAKIWRQYLDEIFDRVWEIFCQTINLIRI